MNNPMLIVILLALVASFMPLQFGMEIAFLGKDDGLKKSVGLLSGITLFRVFVIILIGVIFTSFLDRISGLFDNVSAWITSTLHQLGIGITSGDHVLFDGLLVVAGIALWIQVVHHIRDRKKGKPLSKSKPADDKDKSRGVMGLLLLGFTWAAVSINQWIFTTAAIGQILSFSQIRAARVLAVLLFLLLASLMLVLPIILYLVRPKTAQADLAKVDNWFSAAMPYIVIGILFVIGLYFILSGTTGVLHFVES